MDSKEREKKYQRLVNGLDGFTFHSITQINHRPHPYTVGPKHVAYAADHYGGMLGKETLDAVPCAVPGCNLSYEQHVSDTALFLSLTRDLSKAEGQEKLKTLLDAGMEEDRIDGFVFVETEGKFRFV